MYGYTTPLMGVCKTLHYGFTSCEVSFNPTHHELPCDLRQHCHMLANAELLCSNAQAVQFKLVMWFGLKDCKEASALLHIISRIVAQYSIYSICSTTQHCY
jgi:hypothetical protein